MAAQPTEFVRHPIVQATPRSVRTAFSRVAAAFVAVVAGLVILTTLAPQQTGVLALGQIVLPHVVLLTLFVACVLAIGLRTAGITVALIALVAVTFVRFGSDWVSLPTGSKAGERVALMSWNLEHGSRPADAVAGPILGHDVDVVALQELTPDVAAALDGDDAIRARFPYRVLLPDAGVLGLGILSVYPIDDHSAFEEPVGLAVTLDLGSERRLVVMDTHPLHADFQTWRGFPFDYDARARDGELATIRTRVDALSDGLGRIVLIGDFNTTPTEPGYGVLTRGLRDVHVEAGMGPGWTWRPSRLESFGIGLLRIDLALIGLGVDAVGSSVDCGYPGDHCMMQATVAVP